MGLNISTVQGIYCYLSEIHPCISGECLIEIDQKYLLHCKDINSYSFLLIHDSYTFNFILDFLYFLFSLFLSLQYYPKLLLFLVSHIRYRSHLLLKN